MPDDTDAPAPPANIPTDVAESVAELDDGQLRATAEYIQDLLDGRQQLSAEIETQDDEEIVEITEHDGYTAIVKRQPCTTGCDDCPHGPYLYHVRRESDPRGDEDEELHWSYIGRVT